MVLVKQERPQEASVNYQVVSALIARQLAVLQENLSLKVLQENAY